MAIAFDASSDGGLTLAGTSLTWSHTNAGNLLVVGVFGDNVATDPTGNVITGVTYNGVAMTEVARAADSSDRWAYQFELLNPASGAHNVVISASTTIAMGGMAVSYSGVKQSGQPDASTTNTTASATSITTSVTTIADNCWTVLVAKVGNSQPAASTGSTQRVSNADGLGLYDSGGLIHPAGSYSMTVTSALAGAWATVMASYAPDVGTDQPIEKRYGGVPFGTAMQLRGGVRGGVW